MAGSTCADCKRRRDTYRIGRQGGGTYRGGGRSYSSSICAECAVDNLSYGQGHAMATIHGYAVDSLADIVARLANPEAANHRPEAVGILTAHIAKLTPEIERRAYLANTIRRLRETAGMVEPDHEEPQ